MDTRNLLEVILYGSGSVLASHKAADTGPAARLMPFYSPAQLSLRNGQSCGISSMLALVVPPSVELSALFLTSGIRWRSGSHAGLPDQCRPEAELKLSLA
ncbi:unnamed protein product [Pleuronectes platessa]|uniref:Uncharacterized protein n=1 Tax=Pleuronectes platessa TaxID=8262 RepID=A0A9N7Z2V6_PLEPL|nr:unnamed protein product [Pleuronectes platessa]